MNKDDAKKQIDQNIDKAKEIISDENKFNKFVDEVEKKFNKDVNNREVKFISNTIKGLRSYVPLLISLVKSYVKKEYREVPIGTIVTIVAGLLYFLSPVDLIPDFIPGVGLIDDLAIISFCFYGVKTDLDAYSEWKKANDNIIDVEVKA